MHAYNWHGVISAFQRSTLAFKAARAFDATCPLSLSTPPRRCIALLSPPPTCSARRRHARAAGTTCPRPVVVASDLLGSAAASPACSTSTAYRRAAAISGDQPDTFVRQAIALVALGERGQADAAMARASAIDGRLATAAPVRGEGSPDPIFGDRPAGSATPLAARGQAILRQIAEQTESGTGAEGRPSLAGVTARWAARFGAVPATVAQR